MKKILLLFLLMSIGTASGYAGVSKTTSSETITRYFDVGNPIKFGGDKYYFAWSSRPYDFYMLQEYLPKGQSFEDYTKMFTVSVMFTGDSPMTSADAMKYKVAELEEIKKSDPVCNYIVSENDGEYIVDFIVSNSNDKGELEFVEVDIHYYRDIVVKGMKATYLLFYSCRAYGDDIMPFLESIPSKREQWYKDITELDILPEFKFKE